MKFGQQFEINKMSVCIKFRGNKSPDFGLRTRPPKKKKCDVKNSGGVEDPTFGAKGSKKFDAKDRLFKDRLS